MIESEDLQWMDETRAGNERAFESLVNKYQKHIYYASYHLTHNHADADDILQETMIRFYDAITTHKNIDHLPGWLYRVAVNLSIDKMRYEKRRMAQSLDTMQQDLESDNIPIADKTSPDAREELVTLERRRLVRQVIDELPLQQRTIVILHDLQGLTVKEIAVILEKAEGTVKAALFTAHKKLRQKFQPILIEALGEAAAPTPPPKSDSKIKHKSEEKISEHVRTKK
jgi:RNA polymerase sigma-70 factor, ECF subfamily